MSSEEEVVVEEYQTESDKKWRWRLRNDENHKIIDSAHQGFHDREENRANVMRVYEAFGGTKKVVFKEVEE